MNYNCFNIASLKSNIKDGDLKTALQVLVSCANQHAFSFNKEIFLLSSQLQSLEKENRQRTVSRADYILEQNTITYSVLALLDIIAQQQEGTGESIEIPDPKQLLKALAEQFAATGKIESHPSRLRTKNQLTRKIGDIFIQRPNLIAEYLDHPSEGIVCGICRKIIAIPSFSDVDILTQLANRASIGSFTQGNIVNALAEVIYAGKLSFGEEETIRTILAEIGKTEDIPLQKNVERVAAALNYFITDDKA